MVKERVWQPPKSQGEEIPSLKLNKTASHSERAMPLESLSSRERRKSQLGANGPLTPLKTSHSLASRGGPSEGAWPSAHSRLQRESIYHRTLECFYPVALS